METQLKSRNQPVPKMVGRPIGVVSIESRKPKLPRSSRLPKLGSAEKSIINSRSALSAAGQSAISVIEVDTDVAEKTNFQSTAIPAYARFSAGSAKSGNHQNKKKTFSPADITKAKEKLKMCQEDDFYKVFEIDLHGSEITHIPDLEPFRKLRIADLSGNHISKIQHLEFVQDVRDLKLYDNDIKEVEGMDNLKELLNLQLQHNKIGSLGKGLSNLKKLKCLRLDSNQLNKLDTSELVSCLHLTSLDLSNNCITNLSALSYLPNLEELFLSGNHVKKLTDLRRCKKLQEIDLSRNLIADLSSISGLPALQKLDVSGNQLESVSSLGKLKMLEELNVSHNRIWQLAGWGSYFPKLQVLQVNDNMINAWEEVCCLKELPDLLEVYLAGNPVTLEDGECPSYHRNIRILLPSLEIVDGVNLKPSDTSNATVPLMKPLSATAGISVRQIDAQLQSAMGEQQSLQKAIADSRSRIRDAQVFASIQLEDT